MQKDSKFVIIKAIPLGGGKEIPVNTTIYRTHGVYYMDGGLLPEDYQEDFRRLVEHESRTGWNYLSPVRTRELYSEAGIDDGD